MSIIKPFTFVAGTKARADEVNRDFDVLYSQVNSNISSINDLNTDVENLDQDKADKEGSTSQTFKVANPVNNYDAVNKQTMGNKITPLYGYIDGLIITKDNNDSKTIIVSAGSCYDSTKEIVLSLDLSLSKQNATQSANSTYYVYIIGDSSGSNTDILISVDAVTPTLPTGYTKFRLIGNYTTTSDNNIWVINNNSSSYNDPTAVFSNINIACSFNVDVNLSSYLPNDNHYYMVWLTGGMAYDGSSSNFGRIKIYSDVQPTMDLCRLDGDANRNNGCYGCCPIVVGSGRYIHFLTEGVYDSGFCGIRGYLRLGRIS